jgi:hypothetical protein
METEQLIPVEDCFVIRRGQPDRVGQVVQRRLEAGRWLLNVNWGPSVAEWLGLDEVACGLQPGWAVQDVPLSAVRKPLGTGRAVQRRILAGREQMLVQLDDTGRSLWLPYENLRRIKDPQLRFIRVETGPANPAERLRLRLYAHGLENWNQLTGSLDRLDIDPLPHQIQLVHRILSSGNYNWLIADDVGLGKTIEVGLLLAALKRKGQARRVMVVAPAGLTRQWRDEMYSKFGETYRIYGRDFFVEEPDHWKLYDHVIVSLDLAKRDEHLASLRAAGGWDVVVFDEGHKLTRHASGERAQRYKLAEGLRDQADAFLLLSGTPHQGYTDRFIGLLDLIRPDLRDQNHTLDANPEIVREMILRNRKATVTDAEGNLIFRGHEVHRVPIEPSPTTAKFQQQLQRYLTQGYKARDERGAIGRAIGFVMVTYRKLASSSIAAIERALQRRLERLSTDQGGASSTQPDLSLEDLIEGGDDQDDLSDGIAAPVFFADEQEMLEGLLLAAAEVRRSDEKLRLFLNKVVQPLLVQGKKLLVFTEYRATQTYLENAIKEKFPNEEIALINGSMSLDEKMDAIASFNTVSRFMISTEAGGEGINLQDYCHVMVNYDLPWNPARLVQRIGRLYRYGQREKVVVINLHAQDTFDNTALSLMLDRVMTVARQMAPVGSEYNERLYAEILGELLEHLDVASILESATGVRPERTGAEIEKAIEEAKRAKVLQDEIFSHVEGFDPNALGGALGLTMLDVSIFIRAMLPFVGAEIIANTHDGRVIEVHLPEEQRGKFAEFRQRTVVRITTDRRLAQSLRDVVLLDFESAFFRDLIRRAQSPEFGGTYATLHSSDAGTLAAFRLRWQNDQGEPLIEEFLTLHADTTQRITANPASLSGWLRSGFAEGPLPAIRTVDRKAILDKLQSEAERRLAATSSRFKHPNGLVLLAAADCIVIGGDSV